jgi:ubiquinone/menaquinone biosynthesis C-methylase UbiE
MAGFFSITKTTTVLDIGGSYKNWSYLLDGPKLTLLNLGPRPENLPTYVKYVRGDARKLPFNDKSFDVVYSNSVIEHVGSKIDQMEMAKEMMRVGKGYYCQTPNYWFPVEPHFITPILHWLPIKIRGFFTRWLSVWGWLTKPSYKKTLEVVSSIYLLKQTEMKAIFPHARWMNERVLGLIKSLVAVQLGNEPNNKK